MKKQSGFTLIELMVVMAIIAILATAGLAAYTGYIKKARDTTRIADITAINTIVLGMMSSTGMPPETASLVTEAVKAANNGTELTDPMETKSVCLNTNAGDDLGACIYKYTLCDDGAGFAVATMFESKANQGLYKNDAIGSVGAVSGGNGASNTDGYYSVGSCKAYCSTTNCGISGANGTYTNL